MIVESAALYTVPQLVMSVMFFKSDASTTSLNYMIPYALVNVTVVGTSSFLMSRTTGLLHVRQSIAPLLISYRALKGRLLTSETVQKLEDHLTTMRTTQDLKSVPTNESKMTFASEATAYCCEQGPEETVIDIAKHDLKCLNAAA